MVTILGHFFWYLPYKFTKFYKLLKRPIVKHEYSPFHFSYNGRFINLRGQIFVDDIFLNNDIVERRIYGACDVFIRDPILSSSSAFTFPFISLLPGRQHRRIRASRIIRILRHSAAWQRLYTPASVQSFIFDPSVKNEGPTKTGVVIRPYCSIRDDYFNEGIKR